MTSNLVTHYTRRRVGIQVITAPSYLILPTSPRGPINRSSHPPGFREKTYKNAAENVQVHAGQNLRVMGRLPAE